MVEGLSCESGPAMRGVLLGSAASLLCVRDDQGRTVSVSNLQWSNKGHPLPGEALMSVSWPLWAQWRADDSLQGDRLR